MDALTSSHRTALALQRLVEALADVSLAISSATTADELFTLWSQFSPLVNTSLALQDRMASQVDAVLAKDV